MLGLGVRFRFMVRVVLDSVYYGSALGSDQNSRVSKKQSRVSDLTLHMADKV